MKKLVALGILLSLFSACQKDEITNSPEMTDEYFPLKEGNYWIYQQFKTDSSGNEIDYPIYDSVVVAETNIVNGETYYIIDQFNNYTENREPGKTYDGYWWNWYGNLKGMRRDSSGYLINQKGQILFSAKNFTDTLRYVSYANDEQILYTISYKMEEWDKQVTVPAGSFNVLNFQGTVTSPLELNNVPNPRFLNNFYTKDIGMIKENTFYLSINNGFGRKLVRYHVEE